MDERREDNRRRCLLGARVVFNGRASTYSCTVRNVSDTGAMLIFGEKPYVPLLIELLLDNRRTVAPARVIWRDDNRIGLQFLERQISSDLSAISPGLLMDIVTPASRQMH
ncbi:MAG: PilZ domain-containing protein [Beijerinckiaceae bacterium]